MAAAQGMRNLKQGLAEQLPCDPLLHPALGF